MKQKTITVNGVEIIAHLDGSITKPFHKTFRRTFGYENGGGYRVLRIKGNKFLMHRIVAQALHPDFSKELQVDHQNGDKSDNRIENLRMVTGQQNRQAHQNKNKNCSSQFRGVYWIKERGKWKAGCKIDGNTTHIGCFHNERDAAIARDTYVFSQGFPLEGLNFPENYSEPTNNQ